MGPAGWTGEVLFGLLAYRIYADRRAKKNQEHSGVAVSAVVETENSEWQSISHGPQSLQIKSKRIEQRKVR